VSKSLNKLMQGNIKISISWHDTITSVGILFVTCAICMLLQMLSYGVNYPQMLFLVAVFLISRYTDGYFYGLAGSFFGVIFSNYIFTYPYFAFDFTLSGYPITFLCMLTTSIMTCTMTTQFKKSEKIKAEINEEKLRSNLLRAVSHDLRTPLTSIVGSIQAVIENKNILSDQEQVALLNEAKDDAQWLIRMVENLLSITKISSGAAHIKKNPEAAEEVIGEAIRKFSRRFPDINITVSVPDELLLIPMDPLLIEQVLENLMENSVLHGKTTKRIDISVRCLGKSALFTVLDDGAGIDESAKKHLFDGKLVHDNGKEVDSRKNMGIGLSVCMSIIRAHGGDMTASNMPLGGAAFHFTLPLEEDKKDE
jgi:two-component system sensor histidine kinase KdpD